jgi:hypothetical protein
MVSSREGHSLRAPVIIAAGAVVLLAGGAAIYLLQPGPEPVAEAPRVAAPPAAPKTAPAPVRESPEPARPRAPRATPEPTPAPAPVEAPPTLATLRIETDVPEASVFLDRVGVGTAPLTLSNLEPKTYRLSVSAAGYDRHDETIEIEPGSRTITINFKDIKLNTSVDAVHKHGMGSCRGRLVATPEGIRYEAAEGKDSFSASFADLSTFELDYLAKNLRIRTRQGRTYNFTESAGNLDKVAYFFQDVEKVRKRLAAGR